MRIRGSRDASAAIHAGMKAALRAAKRGAGRVSPNPMVGAALVLPDATLFSAHHVRFGGPHAEAALLDRVAPDGPLPAGAILCVTLEPCCHFGKTPPCVDRIITARPSRVVVAAIDPDPRMRGAGLERLRRAGIPVDVGVETGQAVEGNLRYHLRHRMGRAALRLKLAASLDARLARTGRKERWITGPAARSRVHRERAWSDAVLVGSNTVLGDRPRLTVRDAPGPDPSRIVVDSELRTPARGSVWRAWAESLRGMAAARRPSSSPAGRWLGNFREQPTPGGLRWVRRPRLILATGRGGDVRAYERAGWEVWRLPGARGHLSLAALLARAAQEGFLQVLAEAGPTLTGALLRADLVDEISLYLAPTVLSGDRIWPPLGAPWGPAEVAFEHVGQRRLGKDLWLGLRRRGLLDHLARGAAGRLGVRRSSGSR